MPIERIRITPDEFRTTNANSEITFSSKNLYLKTLASGSIKVGGYDRAPFLQGYDVQVDRLAVGGFGVFPIEYSDRLELTVPFNNANVSITAARGGYSPLALNLNEYYWQSNVVEYSYYRYRDGATIYKPFRWYMMPARFSGDTLPILAVNVDYSEAGYYTLPRVGYLGPWTWISSGETLTLGSTAGIVPAKMGLFFTQPPINLALAVTP